MPSGQAQGQRGGESNLCFLRRTCDGDSIIAAFYSPFSGECAVGRGGYGSGGWWQSPRKP